MTRSDAIKELKEMKTDPWTDNRQMEAIDKAISSLRYDDVMVKVLTDIKAEIIQMNNYDYVEPVTCEEVIAIIDKHIGGDADEKN